MKKGEIVRKFERTYSDQSKKNKMNNISKSNEYFVNNWILGKPKNEYYTPYDKNPITKRDKEYYALIDWTIPSENFIYSEISFEEYCQKDDYKIVRSSFIPIINIDGVNHWLLGSFHDYEDTNNPILADFAGKCDYKEDKGGCPAYNCAMRELGEESKDLLSDVIESVKLDKISIFKGVNGNRKIFFMFLLLDYSDVKHIPELFKITPYPKKYKKENLGPLEFYKQRDIKNYKYRTSKNLTDFISWLNSYGGLK